MPNFIETAERTVQDTSNIATTSGVNALNVVGLISQHMPGPTMDRGYDNLRFASGKLRERIIPLSREKDLFKEHDRLFRAGLHLRKEHKKMGRWGAIKLIGRASEFESDTHALLGEVQTTSDFYASLQERRYTASVLTLESTLEIISRPSSPTPHATAVPNTSFSEQPQSMVANTPSPADTRASEHIAAAQALATVQEVPTEDSEETAEQKRIPLNVLAATATTQSLVTGNAHAAGTPGKRTRRFSF